MIFFLQTDRTNQYNFPCNHPQKLCSQCDSFLYFPEIFIYFFFNSLDNKMKKLTNIIHNKIRFIERICIYAKNTISQKLTLIVNIAYTHIQYSIKKNHIHNVDIFTVNLSSGPGKSYFFLGNKIKI